MGRRAGAFYGGGHGEKIDRYFIAATVVAGALGIRHTGTNVAGEVIAATTTGAANALGLFAEAKTYSTTQADFDGFPVDEEGLVAMMTDPYQVLEFQANSGATEGTALNSTAPANILTNTSASAGGTVVTAAEVGTVTFAGGMLIGRTGNNAGIGRRISAHSNNTSTTVTQPFPRAIAVNDTFYRFPWSKATITVQLTTALTQADAIIVYATGAPLTVIEFPSKFGGVSFGGIVVDMQTDSAVVTCLMRDHLMNPIA